MSLFTIAADGKSITCLACRQTSYNPNDVAQRYCGNCKIFLDPVDAISDDEARRRAIIEDACARAFRHPNAGP